MLELEELPEVGNKRFNDLHQEELELIKELLPCVRLNGSWEFIRNTKEIVHFLKDGVQLLLCI